MTILEVLEKRVKETSLQKWKEEFENWDIDKEIQDYTPVIEYYKEWLEGYDLKLAECLEDKFMIKELYNDYFPQHLQDIKNNVYTKGNYRYFTIAICLPLLENLYLTFKFKNKTTIKEESIVTLKEIYVI